MHIEKMTAQQIEAIISNLSGWTIAHDKLHREFKFKDFVQAWGFMTQVAILAERANHHPEWKNVYNHVSINLITHEADGISQRDFYLAQEINEIFDDMIGP